MNLYTTILYILAYNLILVILPNILARFTKKYITIFGFQIFLMGIFTPILAYIVAVE